MRTLRLTEPQRPVWGPPPFEGGSRWLPGRLARQAVLFLPGSPKRSSTPSPPSSPTSSCAPTPSSTSVASTPPSPTHPVGSPSPPREAAGGAGAWGRGMDAGEQTKATSRVGTNESHQLSSNNRSDPLPSAYQAPCTGIHVLLPVRGGFPSASPSPLSRGRSSESREKAENGQGHRQGCCGLNKAQIWEHRARMS